MNSLPKTVTRQHRSCDLNPGPSVPESSTLTTRLPSHTYTTHNLLRITYFFLIVGGMMCIRLIRSARDSESLADLIV